MADEGIFLPRVPKPIYPVKPAFVPLKPKKTASIQSEPKTKETLLSWAGESVKSAVKSIPKMGKQLAIQLGIVFAVNIILWPLKLWTLPGPIAAIVSLLIFLTATYNNVIPKTIYWVIVFTFGKRLFNKIKKEGLSKAISPIKAIIPEYKKAKAALLDKSLSLLLIGGGIGLIIANNFASYSRFSGARNKIDKYFVAIVISFAVSYILGESKKGWIFKFMRLANNDFCNFIKKQSKYTDDHTFILLSGFVLGLLLDAPLILLKFMYGGYIFGCIAIAGAFVLTFVRRPRRV